MDKVKLDRNIGPQSVMNWQSTICNNYFWNWLFWPSIMLQGKKFYIAIKCWLQIYWILSVNGTYSISKCPIRWGKYSTEASESLYNQHEIYQVLDEISINTKGFFSFPKRGSKDISIWNSEVWKIGVWEVGIMLLDLLYDLHWKEI